MPVSNYLRLAWANHLLSGSGGTALTPPANVYLAISTTNWNADGTGATEPDPATNPRTILAWDAAVDLSPAIRVTAATNASNPLQTIHGHVGVLAAVACYDALTGGNMLLYRNGVGGMDLNDLDQIGAGFALTCGFPPGHSGTSFWHLDWLRRLCDLTFRGVAWNPPALDWVLFFRNLGAPITESILVNQDWTEIPEAGYIRQTCVGPWMAVPATSFAYPGLAVASNIPWWTDTGAGQSGQVGFADGGVLRAYFPFAAGIAGPGSGNRLVIEGYDAVNDLGAFVNVTLAV